MSNFDKGLLMLNYYNNLAAVNIGVRLHLYYIKIYYYSVTSVFSLKISSVTRLKQKFTNYTLIKDGL